MAQMIQRGIKTCCPNCKKMLDVIYTLEFADTEETPEDDEVWFTIDALKLTPEEEAQKWAEARRAPPAVEMAGIRTEDTLGGDGVNSSHE